MNSNTHNTGAGASLVPPAVQGSISDPLSPHQVLAKAEVVSQIDGSLEGSSISHQMAAKAQVNSEIAGQVPSLVEDELLNPVSPHQVAAKKEVVAEIDGIAAESAAGAHVDAAGVRAVIADKAVAAKDSVVAIAVAGAVAAKDAVQTAGALVAEKAVAAKDYVAEHVVPAVHDTAVATKDYVAETVVPAVQEKAVVVKDNVAGAVTTAGHVVQEKAVAAKGYVAESVVPAVQEKAVATRDFVAEKGAIAGAAVQQQAVATKDYVAENVVPAVQEKAAATRDFVAEKGAIAGAAVQQQASVVGATVQQKAAAGGAAIQSKAVAAKDYVVEAGRNAGAALHGSATSATYCSVLDCWTYAPCTLHGAGAPFAGEASLHSAHGELGAAKKSLTAAGNKAVKTVCITGASGYLASHIVAQCLQKGYRVHGTVRDSSGTHKHRHLLHLPGAENLVLYSADLLHPGSFDEAVKGCDGVFHVATPVTLAHGDDGEKIVYAPGIAGLENILGSVKKAGTVKVFVLTSSMAAVAPHPEPPVKSEADWSDADKQKASGNWYGATKTIQEKMAQKFFEETLKSCRFVSICPTWVVGPMLQPGVNATMGMIKSLCQGEKKQAPNGSMSYIDVRDVAATHVAAYENPEARGRFLCVNDSLHWNDIVELVKRLYPKMPEVAPCDGTPVAPTKYDRTRQNSLGVAVRDPATVLRDAIKSLVERGEL